MQKILLSLAVLGLTASVVVGATRAYFSDTETSTGNTFAAGTLNLNLDGGDSTVTGKFTVSNLKPGDLGTAYWTVTNVGSLNGFLDLEGKTVTNPENGCNEPEALVDSSCGDGALGELGANMNVTLFEDADHDGVVDDGDVTLYTGSLDGLVSAVVANVSLNAGVTKYLSMNWNLPTSVGNDTQSDGATLEINFELGQDATQ